MRFYLGKIYINNQGYDRQGYYYGRGKPLYRAESVDNKLQTEFRASSRDAAKSHIKSLYPEATFFN